MKESIRQHARELGFDDCRFTTAAAPATAGQIQKWLADGRQGEMAWLERTGEKRLNPQQVLPGAKTVICLAASYERNAPPSRSHEPGNIEHPTSNESKEPSPHPDPLPSHQNGSGEGKASGQHSYSEGRLASAGSGAQCANFSGKSLPTSHSGLIARYACFADYHRVLGGRLKQLSVFVNQLGGPETRSLWYVDTGPLLEREFAQRAGVGFIGKHTNLISRQWGNWIYLAEIITTLELEPDAPEKNHCGRCARCLAACPTGAITAPFQLDARKCISYLTIELKGAIPVELRPAIGNRIFGCDDCLAVCPWNRFARAGRLMQAHARPDLSAPKLVELLQLDDAAFQSRFAGTPVLRTKRRGLLRNVCVALGNTGDPSVLPALANAAHDPDPLIAEHAQWAIARIESKS